MNEFETIEQELSRLAARKPPLSLRTDVLQSIQNQREANTKGILLSPFATESSWLKKLERTATLASPCLLALSLLIFVLTYRSASGLYQGNSRFLTQLNAPETDSTSKPGERNPTVSPKAFFRQHFAVLQRLNSELFCGTPKKTSPTSGDRQPLGAFRARLGIRVLELASLTPSRGEVGSSA